MIFLFILKVRRDEALCGAVLCWVGLGCAVLGCECGVMLGWVCLCSFIQLILFILVLFCLFWRGEALCCVALSRVVLFSWTISVLLVVWVSLWPRLGVFFLSLPHSLCVPP